MKMYELVEAYQNIMDLDLEEQDLQTVLDSLQGTVEEKTENILKVMTQLKAEENMFNDEIKRLSEHKTRANKKHDNLKEWLSESLKSMNIDKLAVGTHKISFRKSESVVIDDETNVPKLFKKEKITESIDKVAIKKFLKAGDRQYVEGCHLEVKQNIQIK